jgi:predicted transcriptional regulator YdeE
MPFNVTFKSIEPVRIVGLRWQGSDALEIKGLWDRYIKRVIAEKGDVPYQEYYGGCRMSPELPEGEFEYLAAAALSDGASIPEGFEVWDIPGGNYAVCQVPNLAALKDACDWFFGPWLAESGNSRDERTIDFELYPPGFRDDSELFIYMPVKSS